MQDNVGLLIYSENPEPGRRIGASDFVELSSERGCRVYSETIALTNRPSIVPHSNDLGISAYISIFFKKS